MVDVIWMAVQWMVAADVAAVVPVQTYAVKPVVPLGATVTDVLDDADDWTVAIMTGATSKRPEV